MANEMGFGQRLADAIRAKKTSVLVGLDPRFQQLPTVLQEGIASDDPVAVADAYERFCRGVIDVVAPLVAVVKPQVAFFEHLGPSGMAALHRVIAYARDKDLLVVLDGKRNDIGSTAEAYARAYLGRNSAWGADALTVSPYLGADSLDPFVDACREQNAGIFVLVKTSNPGGGHFQDVRGEDGRTIFQRVADHVQELARQTAGPDGFGAVGAVVGATYPEQLIELRDRMPHAWLLVPGFGAQGGTAATVAGAFRDDGLGAIINSSRAIIFAHARPEFAGFEPGQWQRAVEAATHEMIDALTK